MFAARLNKDIFVFLSHQAPSNIASTFDVLIVNEEPLTYLVNPNINEKKTKQKFFHPYPDKLTFQSPGKDTLCDVCTHRLQSVYGSCEPCLFTPKMKPSWDDKNITQWLIETGYEFLSSKEFYDRVLPKSNDSNYYIVLDLDLLKQDFKVQQTSGSQTVLFNLPAWTYTKKGDVVERFMMQVRGRLISGAIVHVQFTNIQLLDEPSRKNKKLENVIQTLSKYKYIQNLDTFKTFPTTFIESLYFNEVTYSTIERAPSMEMIAKDRYITYVTDGENLYLRRSIENLSMVFYISNSNRKEETKQYFFDEEFMYECMGSKDILHFYVPSNQAGKVCLSRGGKKEGNFATLNSLLAVHPAAIPDFELFHPDFIGKGKIAIGDQIRVVKPKSQHAALMQSTGEVLEISTTYKVGFCNNYFMEEFEADEILVCPTVK